VQVNAGTFRAGLLSDEVIAVSKNTRNSQQKRILSSPIRCSQNSAFEIIVIN